MKHYAFSVVELLTAILILAIIAGTFALSPNIAKPSAKHEVEKITAKIIAMTHSAARRREKFTMSLTRDSRQIIFEWVTTLEKEIYTTDKNFSLTWNVKNNETEYRYATNDFNLGCTITVTRDDGKKYYVVIAVQGGRVRASKTPGSGKNNDDEDDIK